MDQAQKKPLSVQEIRKKYPNRIPIQINFKSSDIRLDKDKYLVPNTLTFSEFMIVIRKRISGLAPEEALFLFVNGSLPAGSQLISTYAKNLKNEEILTCDLCKENTFG